MDWKQNLNKNYFWNHWIDVNWFWLYLVMDILFWYSSVWCCIQVVFTVWFGDYRSAWVEMPMRVEDSIRMGIENFWELF